MSDRNLRRSILGVTVGGALLVLALGVLFWRVLPSPVPAHAGHTFTDAKPYKGTPILPSSLPAPLARGIRAAILVEPENDRLNAPGAYERAIRTWREMLLSLGVQIVAPGDADVLVVPQAACLGPVQRRLIQAHLAKGRGIITTGAVGAYDGVCTPLRDTLIASLLGIGHGAIRPAPRRVNDAHYAVLLGESVLGAHMPPGARIEFSPAGQIVFLSSAREMFYCDFLRTPMNAGRPFFDAAALRAAVGPGRVVAFGFSPADLVGDWSVDIGRILVSNAVQWAAGHMIFQLAPWPGGKKAAAVMAIDVEADFQNARNALDALAPYKLPGTAFIVGSLAEADPITTRRLVDTYEIGTHTQRHLPLDTLTDLAQAQELANSKRIAERLAGRPVPGFRPPEERFTPATLQIWADLGGRYVFASNNGRAAAPELLPLLPDSLILLGRVSEDDYEMLDRSNIRDRAQMSHLLLSQVGESIAYRGLYMFSYHSHMMSQKELTPVLQELASKLRRTPEIWTATAGDVAEWWRGRLAVHLVTAPDGRTATLTNTGPHEFTGGRLVIDAPNGAREFIVLPTIPPGVTALVDAKGKVTMPVATPAATATVAASSVAPTPASADSQRAPAAR